MSTQRTSYPPDFKARVAFEAVKEQKTINQLAGEYGVHPSQVSTWKKQLQDGLPQVFTAKAQRQRQEEDEEALKARLYQQIGQLQVELDWLKKKAERAGVLPGNLTAGR
jgi:putative transposase